MVNSNTYRVEVAPDTDFMEGWNDPAVPNMEFMYDQESLAECEDIDGVYYATYKTWVGSMVFYKKINVMETELIATMLGAGGGLVATWVKMTNDMTHVKARLYSLEKQETKVQTTLDELVQGVNDIKLSLAKRGIE